MNIDCKEIKITKNFSVSSQVVYSWYSDIEKRKTWCVPEGDEIQFLNNDFSVGGQDLARCGSPGALDFTTETNYLAIESDRLIVFSETVKNGEMLLACSLNSLVFDPDDQGASITARLSVMSFVGEQMLLGYENGWKSVLENLREELE